MQTYAQYWAFMYYKFGHVPIVLITMMNELCEKLVAIGLSQKEARVYIAIKALGTAGLNEVAAKVKLPKTTVYENLQRLIAKNLIQDKKNVGLTLYSAKSLLGFSKYLDQENDQLIEQIRHIKSRKQEVLQLEAVFQNLPGINIFGGDTHFQIYMGESEFIGLCDRSLECAQGEILFISNHEYWRQVYTEKYDSSFYVPKRVDLGIKMKSLVINNSEGVRLKNTSKRLLREARFLPNNTFLNTTYMVYSDEVNIMIPQKPYMAINIKSKLISELFRNTFYNFWSRV